MIPPQIMQQIQQLAQAAGQSVQSWITSHPDVFKDLFRHTVVHLESHWGEYESKINDWLKKNF